MPLFTRFGVVPIFAVLFLVAGCENSKLRQLSDAELAEKAAECAATNEPTPILAEVCKNVERECQRRREELTIYVC